MAKILLYLPIQVISRFVRGVVKKQHSSSANSRTDERDWGRSSQNTARTMWVVKTEHDNARITECCIQVIEKSL